MNASNSSPPPRQLKICANTNKWNLRDWNLSYLKVFAGIVNIRDTKIAFFQQWYRSVMSNRLPRVKKVAKTLKAHLGGLLTYFKHRISSALTEV